MVLGEAFGEVFGELFRKRLEEREIRELDLARDNPIVTTVALSIELPYLAIPRSALRGVLQLERDGQVKDEVPFRLGEEIRLRVARGDYRLKVFVLKEGHPQDVLVAGGIRSERIDSGRRQGVTVRLEAVTPALVRRLELDRTKPIPFKIPVSPSSGRLPRMPVSTRRAGTGHPAAPGEQDKLEELLAQRARTTRRIERGDLCGARTGSGRVCGLPAVSDGLCNNHLRRARMGRKVLWHRTGVEVQLSSSS